MRPHSRDRITIELRGLREPLHAHAAARGVTTAALARATLKAWLDEANIGSSSNGNGNGNSHSHSNSNSNSNSNQAAQHKPVTVACSEAAVKVTLRLPAAQAMLLAQRARAADVAQGIYVAGLIDSAPPVPLPANHAAAIAALVGSTDQLATTGTDLNAFARSLSLLSAPELERCRVGVVALADEVRRHLAVAAPLLAKLKSRRRLP
jgi:hypothetical protein